MASVKMLFSLSKIKNYSASLFAFQTVFKSVSPYFHQDGKDGQHAVSQRNSGKYMTSQVFFRAEQFLLKKVSLNDRSLIRKPGVSWCFQLS